MNMHRHLTILLSIILLTTCTFGGGGKKDETATAPTDENRGGDVGGTSLACPELTDPARAEPFDGLTAGSVEARSSLWTASVSPSSPTVSSSAVTLSLSARNQNKVVGYYLSEPSVRPEPVEGPSSFTALDPSTDIAKEVSFTLSTGDGEKTIYAWFKDECG